MKTGVAESFANTGNWPTSLTLAGGDANNHPSGKYVDDVDITGTGTIIITFGNNANGSIQTETLALQPMLSDNNDVVWLCGYYTAASQTTTLTADDTGGNASDDAAGATTVDQKYLPQSCRDDS